MLIFFYFQVQINFIEIQNGNTCPNDYLEFQFSDKKSFRLCGNRKPSGYLGGAGPAKIVFKSDAAVNYRGFYLQYQGNNQKNGLL